MNNLNAFVVRPFGTKDGIDFERVHAELIDPAMKKAGIIGSTTAAILEAGNIREDMFHKLLTADIVIADLSIHNANVFYELGIRHALRDKKTYLIRSSKDEVPFDLKTDRYVSYSADNPAAMVGALTDGLKDTINSDRQDSPVFLMLPKLEAQDPEQFLPIPNDFGEEVEIARASNQIGKLALLAYEAEGYPWQIPALRAIAEVQYSLEAYEDAKQNWEKIRELHPDEIDANDRLATIYQRLAENEMDTDPTEGMELYKKSDLAIERLLKNFSKLDRTRRAELYSLKARNAKVKWLAVWRTAPEAEQASIALNSHYLKESYENYERGFYQDLNHFYSGINALSMLTIMIALAENLPAIFECDYESQEEAKLALQKLKQQKQKLATVVQTAIDTEKKRLQQEAKTDPWLLFTEADLSCIIQTSAQKVANLYRRAIEGAGNLNVIAAKRQLVIYKQLGLLAENVEAALQEFGESQVKSKWTKDHYILFTGHMIDKADRPTPRFPASKEEVARAAIKEAVRKEKESIEGAVKGIAGGACGGDILFHEVCEELGIPTELYLAVPVDQFKKESVQFAGPEWIKRFDRLCKKLPERVLAETTELPKWLQKKPNYSIWVRNNLWMLESALVNGGENMTLIALWDGEGGDGPGGTKHMVHEAAEKGATTIRLNTKELFGLKNETVST